MSSPTPTPNRPALAPAPPPVPTPAPEAAAPPRRSGRRPLFVLLGVVGALVIGLTGYAIATAGEEDTDDAQVEADVVPLAPRVGGMVTEVRVADNAQVKKDDVLIVLDQKDFIARAKQAKANYDIAVAQATVAHQQVKVVEANAQGGFSTAQAAFSGSGAAVASAEAQIAAARAAIARAEADARKADTDLTRAKELFAANAVPQERVDNATAARDSAQAALVAAKAQLDSALESKRGAESRVAEAKGRVQMSTPVEALIQSAHAQSDQADSRVEEAQQALDLANNQLSYATVTAPADGVVSRISVHVGQLVQPGQPSMELVPNYTYVVANFKETQIGEMKKDQKVEIKVDAFPGKKLHGTVESLSGGTGSRFSLLPPDNASGNFVKVVQRVPVRIKWVDLPKDLADRMRAGMSAEVTVQVK